ncbi:MAG: threonylcarbamoyl-AMP synthase [Bacteroidetes bacterium]|jgi:tRNA threonylcarbamoyl adenosine modification protein (Sua5/YciO/YrdC/YwlC family)|nr:threonylcarbamoyl-AMP synthase [Bacteroidota bacterium]MBT5529461.1 threonylcarbamoyl-AMP synthase [Cytophagia bacterium]MBT3424233.1 threonylcarbamoyl-AMP synthase [Bacteroidota bacterium]MBT3801480.1 threonylcarbamoyl-AMP synthase [Bacteroidota bacterium]MBT3934653.1 threonylcarbamoyl-AMP synthase [Bacteroidota bacterium]
MFLKVYSDSPSPRHLKIILEHLKEGGILIYPTDTVYGIGCDMHNSKAIDKLLQIIGKKPSEANLSIICSNLSNISEYTLPFENRIYKMMRKAFPGPYTFILNANNKVPKIFNTNKKTVGIRVPENNLIREIVEEYGNPIVTSSIKDVDDLIKYPTNPEEIQELYGNKVDLIIDGGPGGQIPSTIIDCTAEDVKVIRMGKGPVDIF